MLVDVFRSFFSFFSLSLASCFVPCRVRASSLRGRLVVPVTSSYSSITARRGEPMMSCLTSGSRLERNAPHLTDDPATGPASSPSSVPPCSQNSLCVEKMFFVNSDGLMVSRRHFLHSGVVSSMAFFKVQPSSAAVARPVRHRHRSIASCRARATAIFFFSEAPCLSRARYFCRACHPGCHLSRRQTASTRSTRTCLLPCRSIGPKRCTPPVEYSLGQQPV